MAIFRGTTGTGSSDNTIVSAVTEQAGIATTKADEASASASTATTKASEASASATTATNKAGEASADATIASTKATEANTAKGLAEDAQTAAESARDTALIHANTANSSAVQTVAGSNTQVVGVYNNIANVNTVAGVNTDVTTVAGISSDVTTVAADASDIGTVSTNIANVNNVGNNIANVNAVHGNASNINTVAADGTDIGTVATSISDVNTVAGISSDVTTVAGLESKMDTVIADASDIGAVAGNIGDVTTVAGINADVDTVAGIAAKVTTVADNISDVQAADTNATNAATSASNASASATSASNSATTATTKATEASNSATSASNSATTATTKASQAAGSATTAGTSASTATTKASEASASATTATTKAGEAASSASAASGYATTATTKAAQADVSATSAASSATDSSNAASTWTNYYSTYLGMADAPPTTDVQGNALQTGAFYYDTGAGSNTVGLYVYNGSTWVYSTNYNNVTAPYILAQDLNANGKKIISAGNVGIGTTSPNYALDVDGPIASRDAYLITANSSGTPSAGAFMFRPASNTLALGTTSTERMRIDSSGNVGIGTSTVTNPVGYGRVLNVAGYAPAIVLSEDTGRDYTIGVNGNKFSIFDETDAVLTIDDSGNVGINKTDPKGPLHVYGTNYSYFTSNVANVTPHATTQGLALGWNKSSGAGESVIAYNKGAGSHGGLVFANSNGGTYREDMRIDSSGNLLVGTTNANNVSDGIRLKPDGFISAANTSAPVLYANRLSTDGSILSFQKDGTTVGSIGVDYGDRLYIGTGNTGLFFNDTSSAIQPIDTGSNLRDNAVDLGSSGTRFKDLCLSGGIKGSTLTLSGNGSSEHARIDTSGNLLVGTTNTTPFANSANSSSDNGIALRSDGILAVAAYKSTANSGNVVIANRTGTDGSIIGLQKSGTTVGSIGVALSDNLYFSGVDAGLGCGTGTIYPASTTGQASDNDTDLGTSSTRFKDLHLSGTGYFGTKVGIGTTNPTSVIDVRASGVSTPSVLSLVGTNSASSDSCISQIKSLENSVGSGASDLTFHTRSVGGSFASPAERMRIDASGNVGIGTSSPDTLLNIASSSAPTVRIENTDTSLSEEQVVGAIEFFSNDPSGNSPNVTGYIETRAADSFGSGGNMVFATGALGSSAEGERAIERMRIDALGKVGIGTSSPSSLMHLSANTGAKLTLESTDPAIAANEVIGEIDFYSNDASGIGAASRGSISLIAQDAAGAGSMLFKTSNASSASAERLRIDSSGNLLVGTTSQFTGGSKASTTVTVDGSVGRKGNRFDDFDDVWSSGDAVIIEGVSNFNPSNSPNGENWYFVKAVTLNTGASNVYCTQTVTTLTGKIFTRYNNDVVGSGSWTSWVEK
jgi:hypothetical protein